MVPPSVRVWQRFNAQLHGQRRDSSPASSDGGVGELEPRGDFAQTESLGEVVE